MPLPAAPAPPLTDSERRELKATAEHRSTPRGIVLRVSIVLDAADGLANRVIARKNSTSVPTVLYVAEALGKRRDGGHTGGPAAQRAAEGHSGGEGRCHCVSHSAHHPEKGDPLECVNDGQCPGSEPCDRAAYLEEAQTATAPQPVVQVQHRSGFFAGKVRDIVGLYVNPPDKAIVLSVDEKSQIQALDRTQRVLPLLCQHRMKNPHSAG